MFLVIFEVRPAEGRMDEYLARAAALRPELLAIDGFIDNIRYGSLDRAGVILSLSTWRDEKSLIRWRTNGLHHGAQVAGHGGVFADYRLRVGEVTADTAPPEGHAVRAQRLDATEWGAPLATVLQASAPLAAPGGERYEAILTKGDFALVAEGDLHGTPAKARKRLVRVIRDYGRRERREAPQYMPPV